MQKIIFICGLLICNSQLLHAETLPVKELKHSVIKKESEKKEPGFFKQITPEFLYSYIDFKFNSTTGNNFNRFKGHSNIYSAGADHIRLSKTIFSGLYYFNIKSNLNADFLLDPSPLTTAEQSISNNTIFGHVLKSFNNKYYLDIAGSYGQNRLNSTYQAVNNGLIISNLPRGSANFSSANWFVSGNAIYRKAFTKMTVRANLSALYFNSNTDPYNINLQEGNTTQLVVGLVNKVTLIQENLELGYIVNKNISPFVNGGLIQVASFSNSRPLITDTFNGALPQLSLDKNGFRLGGGITFNRKNVTLRVEEKYYNADTFTSWQSIASLEYRFD